MNYLKASTLREMQRVQWYDPERIKNWGPGFRVTNRNGTLIVGHGGSCPGYRSIVQLDPKTSYGVVVFINAAGGSPEKYSEGIFKVLNTYASAVAQTNSPDLTGYTGLYDTQVEWGTETAILPWKGKLLLISLPSNDPIGARP